MTQSNEAAERSAHVRRDTQHAGPDPFVGPEYGPLELRVVAEMRAERDAALAENARLREALERIERRASPAQPDMPEDVRRDRAICREFARAALTPPEPGDG